VKLNDAMRFLRHPGVIKLSSRPDCKRHAEALREKQWGLVGRSPPTRQSGAVRCSERLVYIYIYICIHTVYIYMYMYACAYTFVYVLSRRACHFEGRNRSWLHRVWGGRQIAQSVIWDELILPYEAKPKPPMVHRVIGTGDC